MELLASSDALLATNDFRLLCGNNIKRYDYTYMSAIEI